MVSIIQDKEAPLLHRHEIIIEVDYEKAPPSNADAIKMVASQKKVDESKVAVKKIDQVYGLKKARVYASVYDSVDSLKSIEPKVKVKKEDGAEESK